ncbi:hypothetical protein [Arthrobacter sp. GMC3]|uniref:hypothetical protein n=1 Tax=Arthrobacter sp. GMC3 TaxID=2058894 RepID=UPI000CE4A7B8|nr:hypothetical protein [Arthrobacter sp. GMC3]
MRELFDQFKKFFGDVAATVNAPLPDLTAFPVQAAGLDFPNIPVDVMGAYIGQKVAAVKPLTQFGADVGTGFMASFQQRVLDAMAAAGNAPEPGNAEDAEEAELRAAMKAKMVAAAAEAQPNAWTVSCEGGHQAKVRLLPMGDEMANFDALKAREASQRTRQGAQRHENNFLDASVRQLVGAPYESYYSPGKLVSRGATHDALVEGIFGSNHDHESLAGLAALALRAVESAP